MKLPFKESMKRILLLSSLVFISGFNNIIAQPVNVLNLQDCVNLAMRNATAILKGNNDIAIAGAQVMAAYGQYLPNLVAAGGYNYDGGNNFYSSTGPTLANESRSAFNYQLTTDLNIFNGFYNQSNLKASTLNKQIANLSLNRAKQAIELDVTQSYLQAVLDKKLVVLDSNNLVTSLQREDQLKMLVDVGRRARTDLYQQQAQTSTDKLLLINAQSRLQNDKILLFKKLRIDSTDNYGIADIVINDNAELARYGNKDALVQEALSNRPDLKSAGLNMQMSQWVIKKYRSGYLPHISFDAGLFNNGAYFNSLSVDGVNEQPASQTPVGTQLSNFTYGLVGVSIGWSVFDKNYTRSNVLIAKIEADNAKIDYQDTVIGIVSDVKQAYNNYNNAVQQMETVDAGLIAAQQAFDAVNARYREGATDFITEINAQLVLLQAQQNKIQASVNMMLQKKVIDYYVGVAAP